MPQVTDDKLVTSSTVTLTPTAQDHDHELACRAENPRYPDGFIEDRRRINVACEYRCVGRGAGWGVVGWGGHGARAR